jgi:hypothetical protein
MVKNTECTIDATTTDITQRRVRTCLSKRIGGLMAYYTNSKDRCDNPLLRVRNLVNEAIENPLKDNEIAESDIKVNVVFFNNRVNHVINELRGILHADFFVCKKLGIIPVKDGVLERGSFNETIAPFIKEVARDLANYHIENISNDFGMGCCQCNFLS